MKSLGGYCLARQLGELLVEVRRSEIEEVAPTLVACVPLHRWTAWKRGYNPSEVLAATVARRMKLPVHPAALIKIKRTPPQHYLGAVERRQNVRGVFKTRTSFQSTDRVLLVDDVLTSGSTASESARMLRGAGAGSVHVLVLAKGGVRLIEQGIVPVGNKEVS